MDDWFPKNETRDLPLSPRRRFRISTTNSNYLLGGKVSDISQFVLKRIVDSPSSRWNISRYLPTTTRGLTRNFLPLLRQVRHIFSDSLEYWYLRGEFSSGNIMLLTWSIMSHSKPNSSPSFALNTKRKLLAAVYEYAFACLIVFLSALVPETLFTGRKRVTGKQVVFLTNKLTQTRTNSSVASPKLSRRYCCHVKRSSTRDVVARKSSQFWALLDYLP